MGKKKELVVASCPVDRNKLVPAIERELYQYGDIPQSEVPDAVCCGKIKDWVTICDGKGNVVCGARMEKTDWYMYTVKNAFTVPKYRNKGLATKVLKQIVDKAVADGAKMVAADITYDNKASLRMAEKVGFKPVSRFCWARGEKPAEVVHLVLYPPIDGKVCIEPEE